MMNKVGFNPVQVQKLPFARNESSEENEKIVAERAAKDITAGLQQGVSKAVLKDRFILPAILRNVAKPLPDGMLDGGELKKSLLKTAQNIEDQRNS